MMCVLLESCHILVPRNSNIDFRNEQFSNINIQKDTTMKIKSHYNFNPDENIRESDFPNSLTRPDESISLRDMLDNYTSGYLPEGSELNGRYDDIDENDDWLDSNSYEQGIDPITEQLDARQRLTDIRNNVSSTLVGDDDRERSSHEELTDNEDETSDEIARSGKQLDS